MLARFFENYFIMERIKYQNNHNGFLPPIYFWRTYNQKEIDFIEEKENAFYLFECKWSNKNTKTFFWILKNISKQFWCNSAQK